MASSLSRKQPSLVSLIISVCDELQDILKGPVVHIQQAPKIIELRNRLYALKERAYKTWNLKYA